MALLLRLACGIIPASEEGLERDRSLSSATTLADEAGRAQSWVHPDCGADCVSKCDSVKHSFALSITERTGRSMPYWRHRSAGASLSSPDASVTTAVIVMAGLERSASDYACATHDGLRKRLGTDAALRKVLLVAPAVLYPEDSPAPNELYWEENGRWLDGENSSLTGHHRSHGHHHHHDIAPPAASLSLFSVLDEMVLALMDKGSYPKLTSVIVIGHSAGGQAVQRYALTSALVPIRAGVAISYIVANPGSVTYPDRRRPELIDRGHLCDPAKLLGHTWTFEVPFPSMMHEMGCAWHQHFNDWPDGLGLHRNNTPPYAESRPIIDMRLSFIEKTVTYLSGAKDVCPCIESVDGTNCTGHDKDCHLEGSCHMEVVHAFAQRMQLMHEQMAADGTCKSCKGRPPSHNLVSVPEVGHDGCGMFTADETLDAMFPL